MADKILIVCVDELTQEHYLSAHLVSFTEFVITVAMLIDPSSAILLVDPSWHKVNPKVNPMAVYNSNNYHFILGQCFSWLVSTIQ